MGVGGGVLVGRLKLDTVGVLSIQEEEGERRLPNSLSPQ